MDAPHDFRDRDRLLGLAYDLLHKRRITLGWVGCFSGFVILRWDEVARDSTQCGKQRRGVIYDQPESQLSQESNAAEKVSLKVEDPRPDFFGFFRNESNERKGNSFRAHGGENLSSFRSMRDQAPPIKSDTLPPVAFSVHSQPFHRAFPIRVRMLRRKIFHGIGIYVGNRSGRTIRRAMFLSSKLIDQTRPILRGKRQSLIQHGFVCKVRHKLPSTALYYEKAAIQLYTSDE